MTTVHISLGRDDGTTKTAAKGVVEWEPTTRREDGTMVILERGFTVPLVAGEATVTVDPSGLTWCWRVTERTDSGGTVRYVSVPNSASTVEYVDLPDVDPTTLVAWSPADPEAAYTAALAAKVTRGLVIGATDVTAIPAGTATDNLAAYYNSGSAVITVQGATLEPGSYAVWAWVNDTWVQLSGGTVVPADETGPTGGTLAVTAIAEDAATLTVSGATDNESGLHATPYRFSLDAGVTWTDWQEFAVHTPILAPSTLYYPRAEVRNTVGIATLLAADNFTTLADESAPGFMETFTRPNGTVMDGASSEVGGNLMLFSPNWSSGLPGSSGAVVTDGRIVGGYSLGSAPYGETRANIKASIDYALVSGSGLRIFAARFRSNAIYQVHSTGELWFGDMQTLIATGVPTTGTLTLERLNGTHKVYIDGELKDARAESSTDSVMAWGMSAGFAVDNWKMWAL